MTDPNGNQRTNPGSDDTSGTHSVGEGQTGLGTDPSGTAGTVDRMGATSSDNSDTPMGSLGGGLSSDRDR